jgi:hypothetical protein
VVESEEASGCDIRGRATFLLIRSGCGCSGRHSDLYRVLTHCLVEYVTAEYITLDSRETGLADYLCPSYRVIGPSQVN